MLKKLTVHRCRFTMLTVGGGLSKRWVINRSRFEGASEYTLLMTGGDNLPLQDLFTEDAVRTDGLIGTFEAGYKEAKSHLKSEEEQVPLWRIVRLAFKCLL
jgi:hypothetical protein